MPSAKAIFDGKVARHLAGSIGPEYWRLERQVVQAPTRYVEWMNSHLGFNPRSQQNSDALSQFVTQDLERFSPRLANDLRQGRLVPKLNPPVGTRIAERKVDLVLLDPTKEGPINTVRLAVENKSLMTAHGKARKNRYGDLIAYANHLHNHSLRSIAGATVVVNICPTYRNPDPFAVDIDRTYPNMEKIVRDTIKIFTDIPLRETDDEPNDQPEAIAVIVVDYDGIHKARLVGESPAPAPGHPNHYGAFVERLCRLYEARF